ncbi:MAG: DUF4252 domain-containing protein [Dysgonamonadaceae bacterium]|jgi:cytochrome b involved in lipid metabolism|nr:DUF4252 domain-containing protein [Dysgonamonadaceae bacterium]
MKTKSIITVVLLLLTVSASFAQNDWFDKFSDQKDITQVTLTKALLQMAPSMTSSASMNGIEIKDIVTKLEQIDIFTSDKEATKRMMRKEITAFFKNNTSYEVWMKIKDESDNVTFYAQKEGDSIRSLVMFVDDDVDCVLIRLLGTFTTQDIQKITKSKL